MSDPAGAKANTGKWKDAGFVEQAVWNLRLADLPRSQNREVIQSLFNGDPPFDEAKAAENNVEINRNDLEGVNLMAQARRQWNNAFLKPGNYFSVSLDSGPRIKRVEHAHTLTRHVNRLLKRSRPMMEQTRATGANAMLFGPGPVTWPDSRSPVPKPLAVASVMIPSETEIDFENLEYFAIFHEFTYSQLYRLTHGPRVDPGWNLPAVEALLKDVADKTQKQINATAYQYMPERVEELLKQDLGFSGSDAVPTIDCWDFLYRGEKGGIFRKIIPDWGVAVTKNGQMPQSKIVSLTKKEGFLYDSGRRKYAADLSNVIHCQFIDCSAYAPFRYNSVRSLGWMLWGICDLQNRLHCKFNEAVFESLMWFFRVASSDQFSRLQKANFSHFGVIPDGVRMVLANERYTPDRGLVGMAFQRNRALMSESSASYMQEFERGENAREQTATETMAKVNNVNALVSGMLNLAYTYEAFKYREICRRLCLPGNTHPMAKKFRTLCLNDGVPEELLDVERWDIEPERVLGGGNKTLEMAQAQFLQGIRKNLGADAQRRVDHIAIEASTDDPALAEDLAPLEGQKHITSSMHDAQLATERLMRGLPFTEYPQMVPEDYVKVWLADLGVMLQTAQQNGGMATAEQLSGWKNMADHISKFLAMMEQNDEDKDRARQYADLLKTAMNEVKAMAQRLMAQMKARNGAGQDGGDKETAAKVQATMLLAGVKARNSQQSHALKTAQRQTSFELEEQRKDREAEAEIRRKDAEALSGPANTQAFGE